MQVDRAEIAEIAEDEGQNCNKHVLVSETKEKER